MMSYTVLRLEDVPDRRECFVQVQFTDAATGASIPYAQWLTGSAYDAWKADPESLDALIADWETLAVNQYYDASTITPRQARLALLSAGLLDAVEAYVVTQPRAVQVEWEFANQIRRDWPPVVNAASALGLTNAHVDALFATAARL